MEIDKLYLVCFCGFPLAAFHDKKEAEKFRLRKLVRLQYESDLLSLFKFREIPVTQIICVRFSREFRGYVFNEGTTVQRYSVDYTLPSLDLKVDDIEDLPEP